MVHCQKAAVLQGLFWSPVGMSDIQHEFSTVCITAIHIWELENTVPMRIRGLTLHIQCNGFRESINHFCRSEMEMISKDGNTIFNPIKSWFAAISERCSTLQNKSNKYIFHCSRITLHQAPSFHERKKGPLLVDASIRASTASSDDWDGFADVSPSLYGIVDGKNLENWWSNWWQIIKITV